ncbi:MAG TPA: Imm27 family immunity protein [Gemmatimonadaceae bacterium]|nr:Imm27 family immunity protein [Gemmatimonadaceae bacterium]
MTDRIMEPRRLSPAGLEPLAARRLLQWLLEHGADEFTVAVRAIAGEPAPVADAFEDALAPFELPLARRPVLAGTGLEDDSREVRRWALTADSLQALLAFLPRGLFETDVGPGGWLEDLAVYRRGELLLGAATHEGTGVLRLTTAEHDEVRQLGVRTEPAEPGHPARRQQGVESTDAERDELRPDESDLVGQWLDTGNRIVGDAVCARIQWLVAGRLQRLAGSASGLEALYRDPRDGRLWELTHPHAHWPGGGPPRLTQVPPARAAARYGIAPG